MMYSFAASQEARVGLWQWLQGIFGGGKTEQGEAPKTPPPEPVHHPIEDEATEIAPKVAPLKAAPEEGPAPPEDPPKEPEESPETGPDLNTIEAGLVEALKAKGPEQLVPEVPTASTSSALQGLDQAFVDHLNLGSVQIKGVGRFKVEAGTVTAKLNAGFAKLLAGGKGTHAFECAGLGSAADVSAWVELGIRGAWGLGTFEVTDADGKIQAKFVPSAELLQAVQSGAPKVEKSNPPAKGKKSKAPIKGKKSKAQEAPAANKGSDDRKSLLARLSEVDLEALFGGDWGSAPLADVSDLGPIPDALKMALQDGGSLVSLVKSNQERTALDDTYKELAKAKGERRAGKPFAVEADGSFWCYQTRGKSDNPYVFLVGEGLGYPKNEIRLHAWLRLSASAAMGGDKALIAKARAVSDSPQIWDHDIGKALSAR